MTMVMMMMTTTTTMMMMRESQVVHRENRRHQTHKQALPPVREIDSTQTQPQRPVVSTTRRLQREMTMLGWGDVKMLQVMVVM